MARIVFFAHDDSIGPARVYTPATRQLYVGIQIPRGNFIFRKLMKVAKVEAMLPFRIQEIQTPDTRFEYVPQKGEKGMPLGRMPRQLVWQVAESGSIEMIKSRPDKKHFRFFPEWSTSVHIGERYGRTMLMAMPVDVPDATYDKWCRLIEGCRTRKGTIHKNKIKGIIKRVLDRDFSAIVERVLSETDVGRTLSNPKLLQP